MVKKIQNEVSQSYLGNFDLSGREEKIIKEVSDKTGFIPNQIIGKSSWWGSKEIGAFHCLGKFNCKKAVLKIQGTKLPTSEIFMIKAFKKNNKSKLIRPPHLYASLDWDNRKKYEALILEFINDVKIVNSPTNENELNNFFKVYKDYRNNCLKQPWLDKPKEGIPERIQIAFGKWRKASFKIYPKHPLREVKDKDLIDQAIAVLKKGYRNIEPDFIQGHFSDKDLYKVDNQIVLLSNLYWSWRQPLYDAIFAYHWFIYHLADVKEITPEKVEDQRKLWLDKIKSLPEVRKNEKLLNLALLERAAAGLNLDALSVDVNKPISKYLVKSTREQVLKLLSKTNWCL